MSTSRPGLLPLFTAILVSAGAAVGQPGTLADPRPDDSLPGAYVVDLPTVDPELMLPEECDFLAVPLECTFRFPGPTRITGPGL